MVKDGAEPVSRLRAFQRLTGRSNETMGELLGVTGVSVGRYLNGHREPRGKVAVRLKAISHGMIHAGNYADPVSAAEAAEMMAEIERRAALAAGEVARG